jgi:cytochrome c peroxidase
VAAALVALSSSPRPDVSAAVPHDPAGELRGDARDRVLRAVDAVNAGTEPVALAAEGSRLFHSNKGAKSGESCASCHVDGGGVNPAVGTIPHPLRTGDFRGPRDAPSLWGVADTAPYGLDGREPTLEGFAAGAIRTHFSEGERQPLATTARQAAAIAAYLKTLEPPRSDIDRGTLSPAARRGEELFQGKGGCAACHGGPLLTDNVLHITGVPMVSPSDTDFGAATSGPLKGAFNTPQLRDIAATGPYMHNGSIKTLRDVVDFYNRSSTLAPLHLTPAEIDDLVAYLEAL